MGLEDKTPKWHAEHAIVDSRLKQIVEKYSTLEETPDNRGKFCAEVEGIKLVITEPSLRAYLTKIVLINLTPPTPVMAINQDNDEH